MKKSRDPDTIAYFKQLTDEAMFGVPSANKSRPANLTGVRNLPKPKTKTPNAWTQFTRDYKPTLKKQNSDKSASEIVKLLSVKWKALKISNPTLVERYSCPHNPKPTLEELTEAFEKLDIAADQRKPRPRSKPKGRRPPPPTGPRRKGRAFSKLFNTTPPPGVGAEPIPEDIGTLLPELTEADGVADPTLEEELDLLDDPVADVCSAKAVNRQVWAGPKTTASGWRSERLSAERSAPQILAKDWSNTVNIRETVDWFRRGENTRLGRAIREARSPSIYTSGSRNILNKEFYRVVNDPTTSLTCSAEKNALGYYSVCVGGVPMELEVNNFPAAAW